MTDGGIATGWQKSSFSSGSDGANCVELARAEPSLLLRESEEPECVLGVRADALVGLLRYVRRESR
ncbi:MULTISPECIES: DUF397 domain-containing protein [Streptomyces]|uniref:DUF397 domain-containing protein n=1 Tax=Streptomyces griseoaurantiacus TaxID=68213 RepID=A0ABZ1V3C5_9ACTN|nr:MULTISPECIES: DUF397 domain-containing protein [Streptomyces]MDX3090836.1 DUF397 domain-containing protein [Streptomyces sp. ME12-02E]MDX3334301.1 DUF397 domain-containing protein [Streptomyces sp. ME02-6978a]MDX3362126.1 DUF397 domain-containing protein [Streptomyces sp. ME02-6978.2a]WTI27912.1 DUF397 domain-containing protein [Streptomyces jietaisiensis]